jgi:hypothetical protein
MSDLPLADPAMPVDYSSDTTPNTYHCRGENCSKHRVKLWRNYQSFRQTLLCVDCAAKDQDKTLPDLDGNGTHTGSSTGQRTDQIGWLVPAIPTEDGEGFWSYGAIPDPGYSWWQRLPLR